MLVWLSCQLGGVVNSAFNMLFVAPPVHGLGLALGFVSSFHVWGSFEWLGGYLDGMEGLQIWPSKWQVSPAQQDH